MGKRLKMVNLLFKAIAVWLVLLVVAMLNAALREKLLAPMIGPGAALPVSGLLLSIWIFVVAFAASPLWPASQSKAHWVVGMLWFALTLTFELVLGRFIAGKPWMEVMQVFNILKGDLFMVALLATLITPWLSAKLRGFL